MSGIIEYNQNRPIVLQNASCGYCGKRFDNSVKPTKEHVVGRRFVPKGVFDGQWNLILNACDICNSDKANLEDDISAITMMPDLAGRFASDDERLPAEAKRKAEKSFSRKTRKRVADSFEEMKIHGRFGGASMSFSFTAPAQISDERAFRLAHYHFRGFFYLITYNEDTKLGGFMQGGFYPIGMVRRADWGNPQLMWFMDLVRDWDLRIHAVAADTFFKKIIRRHPEGKEVWAWATEWNHSTRTFGFCGKEAEVRSIVEGMPQLDFKLVQSGPDGHLRMRVEVPLSDDKDDLFSSQATIEG